MELKKKILVFTFLYLSFLFSFFFVIAAETKQFKRCKQFYTNMMLRSARSARESWRNCEMHSRCSVRNLRCGRKLFMSHKLFCKPIIIIFFLLIIIHITIFLYKLFLSSRHAQLMHEKAEVEHKEMEAQMLIFMMNRSARILQKYFYLFC